MTAFPQYQPQPGGMRRDQERVHPMAREHQSRSGESGAPFKRRETQMGDRPERSQQG